MGMSRSKLWYYFLVMVIRMNDGSELREKRWLLPPHYKALRAA